MPFTIIRQDITRVQADVIVNTANPDPQYGEGTDYAIYQAAGEEQLLEERRKIGKITPGEAAVTPALALQAKYIIHTVGPVWQGGESGEMETLASCYRKSLYLAETLRCKSVAFPLISAGTYGFPKEQALQIALDTIRDFCRESEMNVILAVFNKDAFRLSSELLDDVKHGADETFGILLLDGFALRKSIGQVGKCNLAIHGSLEFILECITGFETEHHLGWHKHTLFGGGIDDDTLQLLLHLEVAKAHDGHLRFFFEALGHLCGQSYEQRRNFLCSEI